MTKHDFRTFSLFGAVFVVVGVIYAALSGGSLIFSILAAVLLFILMAGIGIAASWLNRRFTRD